MQSSHVGGSGGGERARTTQLAAASQSHSNTIAIHIVHCNILITHYLNYARRLPETAEPLIKKRESSRSPGMSIKSCIADVRAAIGALFDEDVFSFLFLVPFSRSRPRSQKSASIFPAAVRESSALKLS